MAWYVELTFNPKSTSGDVTAVVVQYANAAAFEKATGALPSQTMPASFRQEPDKGFPTKAAAQAFANSFNKSGQGKGATGAAPYNDYINAGLPGSTPANPLSGLAAIGDFFNKLSDANTWLRVFEVGLGIVLIAVGVAHMTGIPNVVASAVGATPVGRAAKAAL